MKKLLILLIVALCCGCTSAGPYVTNVSSDGRCNLVIEKNMVNMNAFTGAVSAGEAPFVQTIRVCNPDKQ